MQVTNTTGGDLYLAALQIVVADGETVTVDETYAELLTAQGWTNKPLKTSAKAVDKTAPVETKEVK
jgi:hypothetical protein